MIEAYEKCGLAALQAMRLALAGGHDALATERSSLSWVRRYLARRGRVTASTQDQAFLKVRGWELTGASARPGGAAVGVVGNVYLPGLAKMGDLLVRM